MKLEEAVVFWKPSGHVRVGRTGTKAWDPSCLPYAREDDPAVQRLSLFVLFNTLVVRDSIDPNAAHQAFLSIDEYAAMVAPGAPPEEEYTL